MFKPTGEKPGRQNGDEGTVLRYLITSNLLMHQRNVRPMNSLLITSVKYYVDKARWFSNIQVVFIAMNTDCVALINKIYGAFNYILNINLSVSMGGSYNIVNRQ